MKNNISFKKAFTLIELITVIVVIGILAAIVIPNINGWQKEAYYTAISSNIKSIQTSVDVFALKEHGALPTKEKPSELIPVQIDFNQLDKDYLRNNPKTKGVNYWIDYDGMVWASTIDAPTGIELENGILSWNNVEDASYYNIFKYIEPDTTPSSVNSSTKKKDLEFIGKANPAKGKVEFLIPETSNEYEYYLISAIDENEFATPPVGIGYTGFDNQKPVAVLPDLPTEDEFKTDSVIDWSLVNSSDPEGEKLKKAEWKVNGEPVEVPPSTFSKPGEYVIGMRVQDERGNWSDWISKTITVLDNNRKPNAVISMLPDGNVSTNMEVRWSSNYSTDPDGDDIVEVEWKLNDTLKPNPNGYLSEGKYTMELRVQDSKGAWSEWVSRVFQVFPHVDEQFISSATFQTWTVPMSGVYKIESWGAQGGNGGFNGTAGYRGSYISGEIPLTQGDILRYKTGAAGLNGGTSSDGGGGGGSGGGSTGIQLNGILIVETKGGQGGNGGASPYGSASQRTSGVKIGGAGYTKGSDTQYAHSTNRWGASGGGNNFISNDFISKTGFTATGSGHGKIKITLVK